MTRRSHRFVVRYTSLAYFKEVVTIIQADTHREAWHLAVDLPDVHLGRPITVEPQLKR